WYVNDSLLVGHTNQTDSATIPGIYYSVVNDPTTGCQLTSNKVTYTPSGGDPNESIGLKTTPNPSSGVFTLRFFMSDAATTNISLTNMLGQKVYEVEYPGFSGLFNQDINVPNLASGIYVLRIIHGGQVYHKEVVVKR
ncbi:MAG TPA: T9SS type A sorting domain-containing protein, partial [Puia sp.]